jgi:quercetin 2,3-dioxygenase
MKECEIKKILTGHYVMEGAGVKLKRIFGFGAAELTDPFLLFDHFGSDNPDDYIKGFPWHPHRGIETMTFMISGDVEHGDSLGNKGVIGAGDAQWMTAGSGIIHQEMPQQTAGFLKGFQLWVNLPKKDKMCTPKYRDITSDRIPSFSADGIIVQVLSGEYNGIKGAAQDISGNPLYIDALLENGSEFVIDIDIEYKKFLYLYEGNILYGSDSQNIKKESMLIFESGGKLRLKAAEKSRFIIFAGKPLHEPVAWRGPIVMNTDDELDTAFSQLREGTFIQKTPAEVKPNIYYTKD